MSVHAPSGFAGARKTAELIAALREAIDLADEGWAYASDYFVAKHGYITRRNRLAAIVGKPAITGERI
jgi:hypothetical protein